MNIVILDLMMKSNLTTQYMTQPMFLCTRKISSSLELREKFLPNHSKEIQFHSHFKHPFLLFEQFHLIFICTMQYLVSFAGFPWQLQSCESFFILSMNLRDGKKSSSIEFVLRLKNIKYKKVDAKVYAECTHTLIIYRVMVTMFFSRLLYALIRKNLNECTLPKLCYIYEIFYGFIYHTNTK